MSDSEAEESGDEQPQPKAAPQKRAPVSSAGLDEAAKELLDTNRQDRERMEEEIQELRKRNTKRKKQREEEEKRLAAERNAEEERRRAAEEEKKKKKEEEDLERKRKRDSKKAEFEKLSNANKPNFVISKRSDGDSGGDEEQSEGQGKKSREQLEKEKKAILKQRIVELKVDGLDQSGLQEKAKELHKLLHRLEGEKYDLEKRYKTQQVEMMELAERARQANKVGRGGIKRVVLGDDESDKIQERFAGAPAKIEMFSKYERQKDMRDYNERRTTFVGPQYIPPPERIKATRIVKWGSDGMPQYEDIPGAEGGEGGEGGHGGH